MTRNTTITEGEPNPGNCVELWVSHISGEWQVIVISDGADQTPGAWPIDSIEEWLLELIGDLPETIDEARDDPRMYVTSRSKQCKMDRVNLSNNPTAHATYHEDNEEWIVEVLGEEIAAESLPHVLSDEQILLYNETPASQSDEHEREPRTRRLTAFTGIGEATASKLGDEITRIEELLDVETGTLTDEVRSAVPAQYHNRLREEIRHWYQKAIRSRLKDDLNPLDRKCLTGDLDWKDSLEDVYTFDDAESMCQLFRDEIDPDDQLRITIDEYGEFTAEVVETRHLEKTSVWVRIEPASTPLESKGIIKVSAPYRSEYPVYSCLRDPIDSHPIASDTRKIIGRPKITKVERQD